MIPPRKTVQEMKAYVPPLEGRRPFVRLDFNENTVGFPEAYDGIEPTLLTAYPEYDEFQDKLSRLWGIPRERILLTNGSDEGLFVIAFTFIEPNQDTAVTTTPTFALIPHYLKLVQGRLVEVPYTSRFEYDLDTIETVLKGGVKLAVFASPDNPVGAVLPVDAVRDWCGRYPDTLFVIDEAYAEYSGVTVLPLLDQFDNLLVTRTFSKAWGLAGLRLGVVIGNEKLVEAMQRVRSPYSVNALALQTASRLLDQADAVRAEARSTMARKARIVAAVQERGYRVVEGRGNFFMIGVGWEAPEFCRFFRERGILLRDRSGHPFLRGLVRVSVGTEAEMARFLEVLDEYRRTHVLLFDMDGTLVDTTRSFDATVKTIVEKYSGQPLTDEELNALRAEGGWNDDWDATVELLRRRGVNKTYQEVGREAMSLYLQLAPHTENWLLEPELLARLQRRYRLGVVTGRCRMEFDGVWKDRFEQYFELVVCQDDAPQAGKKPEPDLLHAAAEVLGAQSGIYVGNSVDDMQAARAAGMRRIAVTTTLSAESLSAAGAEIIIEDMNAIGDLFAV